MEMELKRVTLEGYRSVTQVMFHQWPARRGGHSSYSGWGRFPPTPWLSEPRSLAPSRGHSPETGRGARYRFLSH